MTYRELRLQLEMLSEEQLDCDVTVYDGDSDDFFVCHAAELEIHGETGALDDKHPYLTIKEDC